MNLSAVNSFINRDWVYKESDCWAIFREASLAVFDRVINEIEIPEKSSLKENSKLFNYYSLSDMWRQVNKPTPGCAVLFKNRRGTALHIGLYVVDDNILHCPGTSDNPGRAMYETLKTLSLRFPIIEFYEYNDTA